MNYNKSDAKRVFLKRIAINYNDDMPPHFHAEYNGDRALIDILDVKVLKGILPKRQLKLVLAWAELNKDELIQNWKLSKSHERLNKISPLW